MKYYAHIRQSDDALFRWSAWIYPEGRAYPAEAEWNQVFLTQHGAERAAQRHLSKLNTDRNAGRVSYRLDWDGK